MKTHLILLLEYLKAAVAFTSQSDNLYDLLSDAIGLKPAIMPVSSLS